MTARYINPRSGGTWPVSSPLLMAPDDGGVLDLTPGRGLRRQEIMSAEGSLWRYGAALRVSQRHVTLGEGWTPLLSLDWQGLPVLAKADHLMPTGSFKDRGTAVMINYLLEHGVKAVLDDTSGNMGGSLAAYAAAGGMRCAILCPASTTSEKIAHMQALGADVHVIDGPRDAATEQAAAMGPPWFYASHIKQPFFLEGTKTVAYELWEQLGFEAPDIVVAPLGQGGNVLGLYLGFSELWRAGSIAKLPQLYAVQAENCAPFLHAWRGGTAALSSMAVRPTVAAGIASARPGRLAGVLQAIEAMRGDIIAVTEDMIAASLRVFLRHGLYVEPTTAVTGAALTCLVEGKRLEKGQRIVLLLTGNGLKAAGDISGILAADERDESNQQDTVWGK